MVREYLIRARPWPGFLTGIVFSCLAPYMPAQSIRLYAVRSHEARNDCGTGLASLRRTSTGRLINSKLAIRLGA